VAEPGPELAGLRARLDEVDGRLVAVAAERQRIVAEIGRLKRAHGRQLRDFARERQVLDLAAGNAARLGLDPRLARELLRQLIEASLASQEQDRLRTGGAASGRRAVVIGGGGRMGRWFARFLDSQGCVVRVVDPAGSPDGFPCVAGLSDVALDDDFVVVAAPIRETAGLLHELARRRPRGVVVDIGSLKTPLRSGIDALRAAGVRVASIHPMFGPSANTLAGRHVIFVDTGDAAAGAAVRRLFDATLAEPVELQLEDHDRLVGWVLGLSHALNLAFAAALADSGAMADRLARASSTTFDRQLAIARQVTGENPHLYFEIQHLNAHGGEALSALERALTTLTNAVKTGDEAAFVSLMSRGRSSLSPGEAAGDGGH
jgi:chorismate mutase/prephenate dehydrogenase